MLGETRLTWQVPSHYNVKGSPQKRTHGPQPLQNEKGVPLVYGLRCCKCAVGLYAKEFITVLGSDLVSNNRRDVGPPQMVDPLRWWMLRRRWWTASFYSTAISIRHLSPIAILV